LTQVEAHPSGDIPYSDWIAALIDWRAVQVCPPTWLQSLALNLDLFGALGCSWKLTLPV
jgi:hypothetical protein